MYREPAGLQRSMNIPVNHKRISHMFKEKMRVHNVKPPFTYARRKILRRCTQIHLDFPKIRRGLVQFGLRDIEKCVVDMMLLNEIGIECRICSATNVCHDRICSPEPKDFLF